MSGPTRRGLLAVVGAGAAAGVAGCSVLRSDACDAVRRQLRLLSDGDYGAATRFVPHERLPDTELADARELMAFRAHLLFPGRATLQSVSCVCRHPLPEPARAQLRALMAESPVPAPTADISKAVYLRYELVTDRGGRTERDVYSDVLYHVEDDGPYVAFVSGDQKARLPVGDCR